LGLGLGLGLELRGDGVTRAARMTRLDMLECCDEFFTIVEEGDVGEVEGLESPPVPHCFAEGVGCGGYDLREFWFGDDTVI